MSYHIGPYGLTNRLAAGQARVSSGWKSDGGGILSFGEGKKERWREGGREANRAAALSLPRRFYARSSRKAATAAADPPNGHNYVEIYVACHHKMYCPL